MLWWVEYGSPVLRSTASVLEGLRYDQNNLAARHKHRECHETAKNHEPMMKASSVSDTHILLTFG